MIYLKTQSRKPLFNFIVITKICSTEIFNRGNTVINAKLSNEVPFSFTNSELPFFGSKWIEISDTFFSRIQITTEWILIL